MRVGDELRIGLAASCALLALVAAPAAQSAETASQSFTVTGEHQFVVPPGVTSIEVNLVGGNGGAGSSGAPGGTPATVTATLAVTVGETLYMEVAGDGEPASGISTTNRGGFGGGEAGGERSGFGGVGGGGGGGASDIRTCPVAALQAECAGTSSPASRLIVAAGGGGGGGSGQNLPSTAGGNGGAADQNGSAGQNDQSGDLGGSGGARGISSAGGEPGAPTAECKPATGERCAAAGQLGAGGAGGGGAWGGGGGGGGSGIFGGGGGGGGEANKSVVANGGGGGGGGGASGVPSGAAGVSGFSLLPSVTGAEPSITVTWTKPAPTVVTAAASALTATSATVNGTVDPNGSQITDCHFTISPASAAAASIPCRQQVGSGGTPVAVSAAVSGLTGLTTYTVTLAASSLQGSSSGGAVSFTTAAGSPTISALELSPTRFHRRRGAAKHRTGAAGTTISFQLSQAASITLSFEAVQPGVKVGKRCVAKRKPHGRGHRCTRYVTVRGGVSRSGLAGANKIPFAGVLDSKKALAPGSYRLTVKVSTASDSATAPQHPTFTLLQ